MHRYLPISLSCCIAILAASVGSSAAAGGGGDESIGVGGGSSFTTGSVYSLPAGADLEALQFLFVQNTGTSNADLQWDSDVPPEITVVPEHEQITLAPNETLENHFSVTVADTAPPGQYDVFVQMYRTNVPDTGGAVNLQPGIGASLVIEVTGQAGEALIRVVSSADARPVDGIISVSQIDAGGVPHEVKRSAGSELRSAFSPGRYRADFSIPDLVNVSKEFDLAADETVEVVIEVETITFVVVAAKPDREDGKVVVAELVASVKNQVGDIEGPVTIQAKVFHDDELVDTVAINELDGLPAGLTDARQTYRLEGGFTAGTYRVEFSVVTTDFTVTAGEEPSFEVSGASSSRSWLLWIFLAVVGLLALLLILLLLRRRRRRAPEH